MEVLHHRDNCRGCGSKDLVEFVDLGEMPLAGGWVNKKEDLGSEMKIPLKVYFCRNCTLAQVLDVVNPDILFKEEQYISSVIKSLSEHFRDYAKFLKENYLKGGGQIFEFGCNDGVLLQYFKDDKNIKAFGIDPAENITKMARDKGLQVLTGYLDQKSAKDVKAKWGEMDVVTGSNVFAHIDDVHEIIEAAKMLLKPEGVFAVEVHYLKDLIKDFQYDTIYHEHLTYYSVLSLKKFFELTGLKLIDVILLPMHGGAIRAIGALKTSKRSELSSVKKFIDDEKSIINENSINKFRKETIEHRKKLRDFLSNLKKEGKSIVGYGAPGRGTILLNYCGIDGKFLDYIVDVSPLRANKFVPGVHLPIYFLERARTNPPDYFLVLAWNYANSIISQEKELKAKGVKFIVPFPEIKVL